MAAKEKKRDKNKFVGKLNFVLHDTKWLEREADEQKMKMEKIKAAFQWIRASHAGQRVGGSLSIRTPWMVNNREEAFYAPEEEGVKKVK